MTRTVEKIKYFQERIAELQQWIEELEAEQTPAGPEPLECWANQFGNPQQTLYFNTEKDAQKWAEQVSSAKLIAVHMRQVTPQDEQDRKDAARYRFYKSMPYRFSGVDYIDFDSVIDKAMQGGNEWTT